ncbi:MAG: DUF4332 domain-containing protein [Tissierellia bacterium]|nr:DUF4332 domain-containing protein [Tissierellia bacterium]
MAKLSMLEGIDGNYETTLKEAGVANVQSFLEGCGTKKNRANLAEKTGISEKQILKWANYADLDRIKGIGGQFSKLLEAAGVDTVPELARRKPENLLAKMEEINKTKNLVKRTPALSQVTDWVKQAGDLPPMLEY